MTRTLANFCDEFHTFAYMARKAIFGIIKKTIHSFLPDSRILLFGSRARGTDDSQSDYDLLVITPNMLTNSEKLNWSGQMHRAIVKAIHAPIDLLLYSEEEISEKMYLPGHILHAAIREGIAL